MGYIDADALIKKIFPYDVVDKKIYAINAEAVYKAIKNATAADVVEVVRCKDCKYWEKDKDDEPYCNHFGNMMTDTKADDYCSYGERKETIAYTKEKHSKKEDVCGITHLPCCYCQPVCGSQIEDTCKNFKNKCQFNEARIENMQTALQIAAVMMKKFEDAYEEGQRELSKLPNLFSF